MSSIATTRTAGRCFVRVLVTGGAGFIGSNLVDRLLRDGCDVCVLDSFDDFYSEAEKRANLESATRSDCFRCVAGDVRDDELLRRICREFQPDAIVHLAARAGVRPSIETPALYADVNVRGTANLLAAAAELEPRPKFVFASSSSVYGNRDDAPFRETDPVDRPVSPYAATKVACELLAHSFHHLHNLPVVGLRFFTAYGPRNRPDLAVAKFAGLIERGLPVPIFGDGSTRRDYTYIDDVVDGIVRAIQHCSNFRIYNIGNAHPVQLLDMVQMLGAALGVEPRLERRPEQPGDVRQTFADIDRARRELGYDPQTTLAEGLARYAAWRREQSRLAR